MTDTELLTDYASTRDSRARAGDSRQAFAILVERYINLVYSAALRRTRDPHLADDVTQAVFIVLSQKAGKIRKAGLLPAWLLNTTRYAASNALRMQSRRQRHEQQAAAMKTTTCDPLSVDCDSTGNDLISTLDDALAHLGRTDRSANALRFFQSRSIRDVGVQLGISEQAAAKRLGRALDRLRQFLARRGVTTSSATFESTLTRSLCVAPPALAATIAAHLGAGTAITASASAASLLAKGVTHSMFVAQSKLLASACALGLTIVACVGIVATNSPLRAQTGNTASQASTPANVPAAPVKPLLLPNATFFLGSNKDFQVGLDSATKRDAGACLLLQSATKNANLLGAATRTIDVTPFIGKRIRFSADVKSENLANWGGLILMATDQAGRIYSCDDMGRRPITKSTDWKRYESVHDIPQGTTIISLGLIMRGSGKIWLDSARVEIVDNSVATTDDQPWHMFSFNAPHYSVTIDQSTRRNGHPTHLISSSTAINLFHTSWDCNDRHPEKYLGKKVRLSAWIKTENVTAGSGLSIRCLGPMYKDLCPDPGQKVRTLKGTTDWTYYELTATVHPDTQDLVPGIRFHGQGKLWFDDLRYEVVE